MGKVSDGLDSPMLRPYLDAISRSCTLTNEEEAVLARRIRRGDHEALTHLVRANLRFVINVARNYQGQGLPLADLINEGNIGMMRAARRFDERKNFRFITYAVWWVRQAILRALADQGRSVKLPLNRVGAFHRIVRMQSRLEQRFGRQPNTSEVAEALKVKQRDVADTLAAGAPSISLDTPAQEDDGNCLMDCLADDTAKLPDNELERRSFRESLLQYLNMLERRERQILILYYGMDGEEPYSLEEIGHRLRLTRERARQLKQRALNRLRRCSLPVGLAEAV
jgi:RNA polymerase primary sigma factor